MSSLKDVSSHVSIAEEALPLGELEDTIGGRSGENDREMLAQRKGQLRICRLDSPDHKAHTAYPKSVNGVYKCPYTHPVAITRVGLQFNYPAEGQPGWTNMDNVTFSVGGRCSGHADFWNTWRVGGENGFNNLNTRCLKEGTFCGLNNQPR